MSDLSPATLPGLAPEQLWPLLQSQPDCLLIAASHRQLQAYQQQYARWQLAAGRTVWVTPTMLVFDSWLDRLQQQSQWRGAPAPMCLSAAQSALIWQLCVDESALPLLRTGEAAQLAAQAWQLVQEYRLSLPFAAGGNPDIENFNRWAARYQQRLQQLQAVDEAGRERLLLAQLQAGRLSLPAHCVLAGFTEFTPRWQQWLEQLMAQGVHVQCLQAPLREAQLRLEAAADEEQELRAAACWMRERARQDAQAQIAVIVPDLAARRAQVQRIFDEQLYPQQDEPAHHAPVRPYNLSLGQSLAQFGLVQTALRLLQLAAHGLDAGALSALLNSPYWGSLQDRESRAALDVELRRQGHLQLDAASLQGLSQGVLREYWRAAATLRAQRRQSAAQWSEGFAALLQACGWPGQRGMDSEEFQLQQRWRELLLEFSALGEVLGRVDLSAALAQLRELAARAVFQPQSPQSRLQVLGVLEAQGLQFDALRVLSLDDERWPAAARAHPFIPHALQRSAGLPHASAVRELAYAQNQLQAWRQSCDELVLSYAQQAEAREREPSPLLQPWLAQTHAAHGEALPARWRALQASARSESLDDAYAPPPAAGEVLAGGARVLGDQARCPFRGYALHRLNIRPLQTPAYGLQAQDRGQLVHRILERLWLQWRDQAHLLALDAVSRDAQLREAIEAELDTLMQQAPQRLTSVLRELESQRLRQLLEQWLAVECARQPFTVLRLENQVLSGEAPAPVLEFAGLNLRLRPDRIDADEQGGRLVLDYKTGGERKLPWTDARPEDPQLLLYALLEPQVRALGFARLNIDEVGLQGLAAEAEQTGFDDFRETSSTRDAQSWEALLGRWRGELETLAAEIRRGWAAVQPKHPRQSCRDCGLHALCRIRDAVSLDEGEEVAE